jgi:RNA polymerase sigma-70 factor (ECF subfamily)
LDQENQAVDRIEFDNSTARALIRRIGEEDPDAFKELYDTTSRLVFGLVLRILDERTLAEEVLLDVYTLIWKEAPSYDPESFMPLEWILTIARTRAVERLDWTRESRKRTLPPAGDAALEMTVSPALQNLARASLESLTPSQREMLDWVYYTGLSSSEIAAQSGKPPGAVKIHTRLGMSKLYDLFRPLYERGTEPETAEGGQDLEA